MTLRNQIDAAGTYNPNHFLITLDHESRFINLNLPSKVDNQHLHVFLHEYWHYLQNISTLSGYKAFDFTQHILPIFSKTLMTMKNGISAGSSLLNADDKKSLETLLNLQVCLDGEGAPTDDMLNDYEVDFAIDKIEVINDERMLYGRKVPNHFLRLDCICSWPNGRTNKETMHLGSWAIEESIAYIVSKQIYALDKRQSDDLELPVFPYRVVEKLFDYILGPREQQWMVDSALATMALLTTHPGVDILQLAEAYKTEIKSESPPEALRKVKAKHKGSMSSIVKTVQNKELPSLRRMHKGRGYSEGAINYIADVFSKAFNLRMSNPLFDIETVLPNVRMNALLAMQKAYPPCDVLQRNSEHDDSLPRDTIFSFSPSVKGILGPSDYIRSLHAQQDYMFAHLNMDGSFKKSSQCQPHMCPYYFCCTLDPRRNESKICLTSPWLAYDPTGNESCWYTNGVAATLGNVNIYM